MIARTWSGRVPLPHAAEFHRHLLATGVAEYRQQPACLEVHLWRRDADGWAYFFLSSIWRDMDAIRAYAGETPEVAVLYAGDDVYELVPDTTVTHYEVLSLEPGGGEAFSRNDTGGNMTRHALNSSHLTPPVGPFSHAVHTGDGVYLSGQVGQDPATGTLVAGGIHEQTRQIFSNIRTLLDDLRLDFDNVMKVTVFLASIEDFAVMNEIYAQYFSPPYPARTTVAVKALPMGALVEMEMIVSGR